jgi:transketolase
LATGSLAYQTLLAARELESAGIGSLVIDVHTIKPFDEAAIVAAARECGAVVTIEEHQVAGGFGSAVAELLARTQPTPMRFVGVHDAFGQSGEPAQLLEEYGMTAHDIVLAARDIVTSRQT